MTKRELARIARETAINFDTYLEIIEHVINKAFPPEIRHMLYKKANEFLKDRGIRHQAFNRREMRKKGFSRIN